MSPALAGKLLTSGTTGKVLVLLLETVQAWCLHLDNLCGTD